MGLAFCRFSVGNFLVERTVLGSGCLVGLCDGCNRMVLGTLYYHWKQVLSVPEHKTKILLFACQNMLFIFIKVHSQNTQGYSSYKIVHNNSFKVTSNKIHTCIQFNVQVQSAVHLVVQFQVLVVLLF